MSERFIARKRIDTHVPNGSLLRQSILELRSIYSELTDDEYAIWYENKYNVKQKDVKKILRSVVNESSI